MPNSTLHGRALSVLPTDMVGHVGRAHSGEAHPANPTSVSRSRALEGLGEQLHGFLPRFPERQDKSVVPTLFKAGIPCLQLERAFALRTSLRTSLSSPKITGKDGKGGGGGREKGSLTGLRNDQCLFHNSLDPAEGRGGVRKEEDPLVGLLDRRYEDYLVCALPSPQQQQVSPLDSISFCGSSQHIPNIRDHPISV
jgi:hypothetical protein